MDGLGKHLERPLHDPQEAPIPQAGGTLPPEGSYLLSEAMAGYRLRIVGSATTVPRG